MAKKKDPRLARAGVSGYNKPKRTPNHKTKSHVVVAKVGDKVKTIRFGQQGVRGAGKNPKSKKDKARKSQLIKIKSRYTKRMSPTSRRLTRLNKTRMKPTKRTAKRKRMK